MFTVIIPAHNEEKSLKKNVETLRTLLRKELKENFVIVIAEDGSKDKTAEIGRSLQKLYKNVIFLHDKKRLGKGGGLKKTVNSLKGDVVFFIDSDSEIDVNFMRTALDLMRRGVKSHDIVIGSRYLSGAYKNRRFSRKIAGLIYSTLTKVLFNSKIKDFQCGFKGFKTEVFKQVNKHVKTNGWFWDTEFLITAEKLDYVVKEIPIIWKEQPGSKINLLKDGSDMFMELIKLRFKGESD